MIGIAYVAEFAIVVHQEAMGQGYASFAMKEILQKGIEEQKLKAIYWCVLVIIAVEIILFLNPGTAYTKIKQTATITSITGASY